MISVQEHDFDLNQIYQDAVKTNHVSGAVVMFVGRVRMKNQGHDIQDIFIEHYPKMTDKALLALEEDAHLKWPLDHVDIIHRVGSLSLGEQIVMVLTMSPHRQAAFEAASYIMDELKISAPFWKKEKIASGAYRWVEAEITIE